MPSGPNLPSVKKGKDVIMRQGHTVGDPTSYGLDPFFEGIKGVADEPKPLKP